MYLDLKFALLYRSHLEFAIPVWNQHLKMNIELLKRVQKRTTKLAPSMKKIEYDDRLQARYK